MWLDSSGLHSSWALTLLSRCDPYVCWSYYEPSGNQWAETHLGAHPLVISLISLLALAIWALSQGQWLSVQRDWSGSSYRSLINGCGWGDGSFLSPFSFLFFCFPLLNLWYRCVMYVMLPWGVPDDWHEPPGRQADWLAGRSSPTWGFDMDNTHILLFAPPHTFFRSHRVHCNYSNSMRAAVYEKQQSMILENHLQHHFPRGDAAVWVIIGTF